MAAPTTPFPTAVAQPSATGTPEPAAGSLPPARARLTVVANGFDAPLGVVTARDGSGRLFVIEQGGWVRLVREGRGHPVPCLDVSARISSGGERGRLGLAFHPTFPADPRLFVNYTDRDGNSQNLDALLGKILRIDVDRSPGGQPYAIPPDSPFPTGGGAPEIWAYGLRNPWRFSFDTATGDLWIGDVGQSSKEEIDVIRAATRPPVNLGWDVTEADLCFEPTTDCDAAGITFPVASYTHDDGCSVIGGVVARGDATGSLDGRYLFSDFCSGTIWWLDPRSDGPTAAHVLLESRRSIASVSADEAGRILLVDLEGGALLAIEG